MADTYVKVFGSNPSAASLTDAYTVAAATSAIISTIVVANRSATATSYRMSHALAGAADDAAQYFAYDVAIAGNGVHTYTLGIAMAATDVLRVYATLATLTFTGWGVKKT